MGQARLLLFVLKGYAKRVRRVLLITLAFNLVVAVGKLVVGYRANSLAVLGDGLHSLVDAGANVIAILVLRLAEAPPDEDHPFGHQKFETIAAFVLSGLLFLTSFELGRAAIMRILSPEPTNVNFVTVSVMLATLVINVFVATMEKRAGKREASQILLADAAQTRSDIFVTLGVLLGLALVPLGIPFVDPVLAIAVAIFIGYSAYAVFRDTMPVLTDRAVFDPVAVARIVKGVPGVRSVHDIRSRGGPRESFVQMHLVVDAHDVASAHDITDEVERRVSAALGVKEVFVHVEPEDDASGPPGTRGEPSS